MDRCVRSRNWPLRTLDQCAGQVRLQEPRLGSGYVKAVIAANADFTAIDCAPSTGALPRPFPQVCGQYGS